MFVGVSCFVEASSRFWGLLNSFSQVDVASLWGYRFRVPMFWPAAHSRLGDDFQDSCTDFRNRPSERQLKERLWKDYPRLQEMV